MPPETKRCHPLNAGTRTSHGLPRAQPAVCKGRHDIPALAGRVSRIHAPKFGHRSKSRPPRPRGALVVTAQNGGSGHPNRRDRRMFRATAACCGTRGKDDVLTPTPEPRPGLRAKPALAAVTGKRNRSSRRGVSTSPRRGSGRGAIGCAPAPPQYLKPRRARRNPPSI